jgi:hypothetical protein
LFFFDEQQRADTLGTAGQDAALIMTAISQKLGV